MSIHNQEEHIGHVKQPKSDRFQDRTFYIIQRMVAHNFSPKTKT